MINEDIQSGVLDHADCSSEARSKSIEKSAPDGGDPCMSEQRADHGQRRPAFTSALAIAWLKCDP
jgi:hypothetical protein